MGNTRKPLRIHWSGNTGNLVGVNYHGKHFFRSRPAHYRDRRSTSQLAVRERLAAVSSLIRALAPSYKFGYRHYNLSETPRTNFFHQIWSSALLNSDDGSFYIDLSLLLISRGPLPNSSPLVTPDPSNHSLTLSWNNAPNASSKARLNDRLLVCLFNPELNASITLSDIATRADLAAVIILPPDWPTQNLHLYTAWLSPSAASDSIHQAVTIP